MWHIKADINHPAWCRLTSKALDERRTLAEQAAWELEQAMVRWARQQVRAGLRAVKHGRTTWISEHRRNLVRGVAQESETR